MVKKITLPFILELKNELLEDKLEYLKIFKEDNHYIADYKYSNEELNTNRYMIVQLSNELEKFAVGVLLDSVFNFEIIYKYDDERIFINSAYSSEINNDNYENYNLLIDSLNKSIFLIEQLEMMNFKINDLYERVEFESKSKTRTKYMQLELKNALNHIVESLNRG